MTPGSLLVWFAGEVVTLFLFTLVALLELRHDNELTVWAVPIIVNLDVMPARRKKRLTELSEHVGITMANLSNLKTGKARAIRFTTLEAICAALDCQPGDLIEHRPTDNPAARGDTADPAP